MDGCSGFACTYKSEQIITSSLQTAVLISISKIWAKLSSVDGNMQSFSWPIWSSFRGLCLKELAPTLSLWKKGKKSSDIRIAVENLDYTVFQIIPTSVIWYDCTNLSGCWICAQNCKPCCLITSLSLSCSCGK